MREPDVLYRGERLDGSNGVDVLVTVDGRRLWPSLSWKVRNHSPTGFEWGYNGSGPSQLALALVLDALNGTMPDREVEARALACYVWFRWATVACWEESWTITAGEIRAWVDRFEREHTAEPEPRPDDDGEADTPIELVVGKEGAD